MDGKVCPESVQYADFLIERLKNGQFPRYNLPNHGEDFSGGPENLAREKFISYMGSCSHMIMRMNTDELRCRYYG